MNVKVARKSGFCLSVLSGTALLALAVSGSTLLGGVMLARADDSAPLMPSDATAVAGSSSATTEATSSDDHEKASGRSESAADGGNQVLIDNEDDDVAGKFNATYVGIFYGPSVSKPTSFQATQDGVPEADKPVMLKNFLGLGYNLTDHVRVTPTAYWQWMPTGGGAYSVQDPFLKLSDDAIFSTEEWNLYADLRYHVPTSAWSHATDVNGSVQSVQVLTFLPQGTRYMFGLLSSEREYFYGPKGQGNDVELYVGPNVNYQLTPSVQLTMLYELNAVHIYGAKTNNIQGDGNDLEPGLSWDITPRVNVHPYLNLFPTSLSLSNISVGMLLYWQAF
jgi:hypothetical protein